MTQRPWSKLQHKTGDAANLLI
ncbi:hypothetical protein [Escherichia coli]